MIQIEYRESRPNGGAFALDFGWDEGNFDYVVGLLRRAASVLPTYEEECRYCKMIERMTARRNVDNQTTLTPEEMAELARCLVEFMCEADAVMGITEQDEGDFSDMVYAPMDYTGGFHN